MASRRSQSDKAINDAEDDWTKVSDPTSRRRMQNRLAQRNYRNTIRKRLDVLEQRLITHGNVEINHPPPRHSPGHPAVDCAFPAMDEFNCDTIANSYFTSPTMFQQPFCGPGNSDGRQLPSNNNTKGAFFQHEDPAALFEPRKETDMPSQIPVRDANLYDDSIRLRDFLRDMSPINSSNRSWEMMDAMDTMSPAHDPVTVHQTDGNSKSRSPRATHSDSSDMTLISSRDPNLETSTPNTTQDKINHTSTDSNHIPNPQKETSSWPDLKLSLPPSSHKPPPSAHGMTTLHLAILKGHVSILKILLSAGMDINSRDALGRTALHIAAQEGSLEGMALLVENGARLDVVDERGMTALHYAVECGWEAVVAGLLESGADASLMIWRR